MGKPVNTNEGDSYFANPAWAAIISCPECGMGLHQNSVEFTKDNDAYDGKHDGYSGRGEYCVVTFNCESGHEARLIFGNHKGALAIGLLGEDAITKLQRIKVSLGKGWKYPDENSKS